MEISQILSTSGAAVTIAVTAEQLHNFAKDLIQQERAEIAAKIAEQNSEVFYTREQVMGILNVCDATLYNWSRKNFLCPIRVGGLNRYRKSDIDRILNR